MVIRYKHGSVSLHDVCMRSMVYMMRRHMCDGTMVQCDAITFNTLNTV